MQIINSMLPEYCYSWRKFEKVEGVILHHFSCKNVEKHEHDQFNMDNCRDLFIDLNLSQQMRRRYMKESHWPATRQYASAHFLIGRFGEVHQLVPLDHQAWHAGASMMNGRSTCNAWTLGVELVGTADSGFTREQYTQFVNLLMYLEDLYGFPRANVAGHDYVRWAYNQTRKPHDRAPVKDDPSGQEDGQGTNFNWFYLGKMWNDRRANPAGTLGVEYLDEIVAAEQTTPGGSL